MLLRSPADVFRPFSLCRDGSTSTVQANALARTKGRALQCMASLVGSEPGLSIRTLPNFERH